MAPDMAKLAADDQFAAYCLPAGVMVQLFHCAAAGSPGWMTHVGLDTFVDPRREGGKLNARATENPSRVRRARWQSVAVLQNTAR